jgi:serine protease Do
MPRPPTHYQVLGLNRDASSVDIADAFREKLGALKAQPDGGSVEEVQSVREAYQVLANPILRANYDAELPSPKPGGAARAGASDEPGPLRVMMDVLRESGMIKFIVPVLVLVAVAIFFKMRQPSQEYAPPRIVEVARTVVQEAAKKEEEDEPAAPTQAGAAAPETAAAPATASATAMTAEEIFANVSGSIARIQVADSSGKMFGQGSGVVVGSGIVITNCHVVADAWQISVKVGDKVLPGVVVVADKQLDLCSLRVSGLSAPSVSLGAGEVRVGQRVYAIGSPQGLELTLSEGIVSSLRDTTNGAIIQTTAPVSPGSSGGGLFSANGQLVGIVTFQHKTGQNLNFAVPAAWISEMKPRAASENVAAPVARAASSPQ